MDREQLDRALETHAAVGTEPRPTRVHPDRATRRGLKTEARTWAAALLRRSDPVPFLIYARPRSGTTLLCALMGAVPGVEVRGELLHHRVLAPRGMLWAAARRARGRAFGFKVLSYQLMDVQQVHRPVAFFDRALALGYQLVHLRRDTWDQTLSLVSAQAAGVYVAKPGRPRVEIEIDPARFVEMYAWNRRMLDYEDSVMAHLPHLRLDYGADLSDAARQQRTVDRLCASLGTPSGPVKARTLRTGGDDGLVRVRNLHDVYRAARDAGIEPPCAARETPAPRLRMQG